VADDRKRPSVDDQATVPVPLVDPADAPQDSTPPPLPPSPGSAQAEQWFDDAPTRPSALTDIAPSMTTTTRSGVLSDRSVLTNVPAPPARPSPSYGLLALVALTFLVVGVVVGALLFSPR
jgi:hypothetical protein